VRVIRNKYAAWVGRRVLKLKHCPVRLSVYEMQVRHLFNWKSNIPNEINPSVCGKRSKQTDHVLDTEHSK